MAHEKRQPRERRFEDVLIRLGFHPNPRNEVQAARMESPRYAGTDLLYRKSLRAAMDRRGVPQRVRHANVGPHPTATPADLPPFAPLPQALMDTDQSLPSS